MAEQNLGRVRMHFAGLYNESNPYSLLDYVYYGGDNADIFVATQNIPAGADYTPGVFPGWQKISVNGPTQDVLRTFTKVVSADAWAELSDESVLPFTHKATIDIQEQLKQGNISTITLLNDDIILFATHCVGIYSKSSSDSQIVLYSIGNPGQKEFRFSYMLAFEES